jgi:Polysaccharide deacetylase.
MFMTVLLSMSLTAGATTYIVFRYDDLAGDAPGVRETDVLRRQLWEAEQAVDRMFQKYGFSYTIAIIPNRNDVPLGADAEKVEFIRNAVSVGRVEVAQHGLSHINHAKANRRAGEFRDRDYQSQFQDIKKGREILLSALGLNEIAVFVPPWNAWTGDTAKVLKTLEFTVLSVDSYYYYKTAGGLTIVPFTTRLSEFEAMLDQNTLPDDSIVVVIYHPFEIEGFQGSLNDNHGSDHYGVDKFGKLLQKLSGVNKAKVVTLEKLTKETRGLTLERYHAANGLCCMQHFWAKLLPEHLLPGASQQPVYLSAEVYLQNLRFWNSLTLVFSLIVLALGLLVRYSIGRKASDKWHFGIDVTAILLLIISIISEVYLVQRGYHTTGIRAVPGLFAGGFLLGSLLSSRLKTRRHSVSKQYNKF